MNIDLFSAFIIGLLSAGHCISMCGGITSMLTSALPHQHAKPQILLVFCYNLGRISTYALIGALVGYSGSLAAKNIGLPLAGLRLVAGIFLVLLGLYLGKWLMWLSRIESIGRGLWRLLSPLTKKVIPVNSPVKALALGSLWGWLPCGLVYSTLTWALASGDALSGAAIMACFGIGTLPALLTMSFGVLTIKRLLSHKLFRQMMALAVIVYGLYSIYIAWTLLF